MQASTSTALDEDEVDVLRGRPCWLVCGPLLGIFALQQAWGFIRYSIFLENLQLAKMHSSEPPRHGYQSMGVPPIHDARGRAVAAVWVVGLSFLLAVAVPACLQHIERTSSRIRASLLIQFMLRGSFLATPLALLVQSATMKILACGGRGALFPSEAYDDPSNLPVWNFLLYTFGFAFLAGFSEEVAKLLALLLCTDVLSETSLSYRGVGSDSWRQSSGHEDNELQTPLYEYQGCFGLLHLFCRCRSVIESGSALTLAGVSIGLGFMIIENLEYAAGEAVVDGTIGRPSTIWTVGLFRMLCNLHWVLAGLSASRLADLLLIEPVDGSTSIPLRAWPSFIANAVWPSVCFHAAWDFMVLALTWRWFSRPTVPRLALVLAVIATLGVYYVCLLCLLWRSWPAPYGSAWVPNEHLLGAADSDDGSDGTERSSAQC